MPRDAGGVAVGDKASISLEIQAVRYEEIFIMHTAGGRIAGTWGSSTSPRRCGGSACFPPSRRLSGAGPNLMELA